MCDGRRWPNEQRWRLSRLRTPHLRHLRSRSSPLYRERVPSSYEPVLYGGETTIVRRLTWTHIEPQATTRPKTKFGWGSLQRRGLGVVIWLWVGLEFCWHVFVVTNTEIGRLSNNASTSSNLNPTQPPTHHVTPPSTCRYQHQDLSSKGITSHGCVCARRFEVYLVRG